MTAIAANSLVAGAGNNAAKRALRVTFPNAGLAGHPILEAYTTGGSTPAVVLGGNADAPFSTGDSCVYAIPTIEYVASDPTLANWAAGVDFANSPAYRKLGRKLQGSASVLQLLRDGTDPNLTIGQSAEFNTCFRLGASTSTTVGANNYVLACRYIYTGATDPTVIWEGNSASAGGTDASPQWRAISGNDPDFPGVPVRRLLHANLGADPSNPVITKPTSGNTFSQALVAQPTA